jgi:mycothiol system anti-sigma-R factor
MSCGQPHDVDCVEVLEQVYSYLDGEMGDDAKQEIREHLDECAPCLRQFGIEQEVKALVARCCGGESAPDHFRERLRLKLAQVELEMIRVEFRAE